MGVVVGVVPLVAYGGDFVKLQFVRGIASGHWLEVRGGRCTEVSKHISSM